MAEQCTGLSAATKTDQSFTCESICSVSAILYQVWSRKEVKLFIKNTFKEICFIRISTKSRNSSLTHYDGISTNEKQLFRTPDVFKCFALLVL